MPVLLASSTLFAIMIKAEDTDVFRPAGNGQ
jgi:hypothetical protein